MPKEGCCDGALAAPAPLPPPPRLGFSWLSSLGDAAATLGRSSEAVAAAALPAEEVAARDLQAPPAPLSPPLLSAALRPPADEPPAPPRSAPPETQSRDSPSMPLAKLPPPHEVAPTTGSPAWLARAPPCLPCCWWCCCWCCSCRSSTASLRLECGLFAIVDGVAYIRPPLGVSALPMMMASPPLFTMSVPPTPSCGAPANFAAAPARSA
mmetsp:Transcript_35622/g.115475  ORF Transcript_35622/g.115475 Transcript_35622/m.115475 type:complete len:210 (+) Transcript_35622:504-1133(+)